MAGASTRPEGPDDVERRIVEHVQAAGDLLRTGDAAGAERESEVLLRLAPDDPRTKNLLGLLRFRTGRYEEALAVYTELVEKNPHDLSLRLNLGLVELRMGHHAEAATHLERLVRADPENKKAQGYFGLALMRSGQLEAARQAFLAAGQLDLVRQVEAQTAAAGGLPDELAAAPATQSIPVPLTKRVSPPAEHPVAAAEPRRPPPSDAAPLPVAASAVLPKERAGAHPLTAAAPVGPAPSPAAPAAAPAGLELPDRPSTAAGGPVPVKAFVAARALRPPTSAERFRIDDGLLLALVEDHLCTRIGAALVSSGKLSYAPMARRTRGVTVYEPFGAEDDAMCLASGQGVMVSSPRGGAFCVLALDEDVVYLRESVVYAFEDDLAWENGRIPGSGGTPVVQFRGSGKLALRTARPVRTVLLTAGEVFYADQEVLCGWTGEVVPQQLRGADGQPTPFVVCTGEGALLLVDIPAPDAT